jgi:hypothetical protein
MRTRVALALAVSAALAGAAPAHAGIYERVLAVYEADAQIPPCHFTSQQLTAALKGVDTYGAQYFADFTEAVQAALAQRASGVCSGAAARANAVAPASARTPALRLPASATSPTDSGLPAPILAMGGLALAAALGAGLRAISRASGWEPAWAPAWRHAWAEAAYRAGGRLAQVRDALRALRRPREG